MINNMKEYNCIMRHGIGAGLNSGYWIDANDVAKYCDNPERSDLLPIDSDICNCVDSRCSNGGDTYTLKIVDDCHYRGNYCDRLDIK